MLGGRVFGGSREEPRLSQLKKRRSEDRRRPTVDGKSPTGSEQLRRRRTSRFRSYHLPRPIFLPSFQSQRAERDSRDRDREETATGASCSISCDCIVDVLLSLKAEDSWIKRRMPTFVGLTPALLDGRSSRPLLLCQQCEALPQECCGPHSRHGHAPHHSAGMSTDVPSDLSCLQI